MAAKTQKKYSWQAYLLQLPLWSALILLVMVSLLVVLIRFLVPKIDTLRPEIETWLTTQLPFDVEISRLSGSLFKIDPAVGIEKLTLSSNGQVFLIIEDVYFELDTLASLVAAAPRMKDARLSGLELWLEETTQGWQLNGWQKDQSIKKNAEKKDVKEGLKQVVNYVEQFLVQGELGFSDLKFHFTPLEDESLFFSAESMEYRRWSGGRQLFFEIKPSTVTTQPAELVVTLEGEGFDPNNSSLSAWFNFPLVDLNDFQALWPSYLQEETQNLQGHFSLEGWLSLTKGLAKAELQARNIELIRDELWKIQFSEADLSMQGKLDDWSADWKVSNLNASDYTFDQLAGRVGYSQQQAYLQVEELKLDPLAVHLTQDTHLPESVRELVGDLAPGGSLTNLLITREAKGELELQANLQDVQVNAWRGAPLGSGLNGWLQANAQGGQVVFANHSLELGFPQLYSPVWNFSHAKGAVRWELEGDDLWVIGEDLAVVLPFEKPGSKNVYVSGDFAYFYGPSDQRFYLGLGLLPTDALAHHQLVPDKLVEPVLHDWLANALLAGEVHQAGFIYAGSIQDRASFQLVTDFSETDFKFQPDWPKLTQAKGQVQVLDGWVKGEVVTAGFGQSQLTNASFSSFLNQQNDVELQVTSKIEAPLEFFPWLVKNSPLQKEVPIPLHEWVYSGQIKGAVDLSIPLSETGLEPKVALVSQISDAQLRLSQVDLAVTEINGPLNFTLAKGLESSGLVGKVMSQPVKAAFNTQPESQLVFSARLAAKDLKKRFNLPEALDFTGVTQLQGELPLAPFGVLEVTSSLEGLAYATPLPWNKDPEEKRDFSMQLDFSADELPLKLNLADQLSFLMHLDQPARGICLELADEQVAEAALPEKEGLHLGIVAEEVNAKPLVDWLKQFDSNSSTELTKSSPSSEFQWLNQIDLKVNQLNWDSFELGQLGFSLNNSLQGIKLGITNALVTGEIDWPEEGKPLGIRLDHLYLPAKAKEEQEDKEASLSKRAEWTAKVDPLADFNPKLLPNSLITIKDFRQGKKRFGELTAQTQPLKEGVRFDPLQIKLEETSLTAQLDWQLVNSQASTFIQGDITGKNIEPALIAVTGEGKVPIISGKHQFNFTTGWQGSPLAFDLQKVSAGIELELKDGYFPETDLALSGISQLFGLLNMDTLLRRLRLDFSDLKNKGVSYDSIKGGYQLDKGYLATLEPTRVVSSATRMSLEGEVDLIEETLEQELVVVLPVAQSLPLAAVVVGAPQVGAAIWVVQKVFSNLFDTFSEARYKISGPLNKPKTELKRIF
ncbi:YhdP family protein [Marinospirillum insulare]|uniref:TIGR02099 family protein n=1 Tax=Marinospirillum insulare TaxID=217169 RepID=A0ABQ5ZX28_9GAMM|nr:YhdP family protein [Marinospirillum insulare]GLR64735.1 TIGR02099 family protein [Marinospirillum insulare]